MNTIKELLSDHESGMKSMACNTQAFYKLSKLLGVFLLVSSSLKTYNMEAIQDAIFNSILITAGLIIVELGIAIWLLSGYRPIASYYIIGITFISFLAANLFKAIVGIETCGCFGNSVKTRPWQMALFDAIILLLLLACHPHTNTASFVGTCSRVCRSHLVCIFGSALLVVIPYHATDGVNLEQYEDGSNVRFSPDKWKGIKLPLLDSIDIGKELEVGDWVVLLYHHDCPICVSAILDLANGEKAYPNRERIAFVELPPLAPPDLQIRVSDSTIKRGTFWNTEIGNRIAPLLVRLKHGYVMAVSRIASRRPPHF